MNENVTVCITPKGEKPVLHFSQYDNERVFTVTVLADDGESAAVLTGLDIEFRIRKTDSHVVTIAPESVADNVITFKSTEQMCACCGQNIASVVLMKDDMNIATLDILVEIQRDILSGGLTSESDIRNLTTQIEQIVPEVIGDDYYTKTEVDELIDDIPTFDPTNYYNKSDVDGLLADKADKSDTYTKSAVDTLIRGRMGNIEFTTLAPGSYQFATFTSLYNAPVIDIEAEITTTTSTINLVRCGKNLVDNDTYFPMSDSISNFYYFNFAKDLGNLPDIRLVAGTTYTLSFTINSSITPFNISVGCGSGTYATDILTKTELDNGRVFITFTPTAGQLAGGNLLAFRAPRFTSMNNVTFTVSDVQLEFGSSASDYVPYNGQVKTITLGTPVLSGTIDFSSGTINDSGNIITFTPVTVDAALGVNNVFIDVGNITTLTYVSQADYGLMTLLEAYTKR